MLRFLRSLVISTVIWVILEAIFICCNLLSPMVELEETFLLHDAFGKQDTYSPPGMLVHRSHHNTCKWSHQICQRSFLHCGTGSIHIRPLLCVKMIDEISGRAMETEEHQEGLFYVWYRDEPWSRLYSVVLRDSTPRFVCPSVSRSVGHILLFCTFFSCFCSLWLHCSCPNALVTSNMAPV